MSLCCAARHVAFSALTLSTLALSSALPAMAQDRAPKASLLDFFDPDRIAARFLQMGIAGLRTQADVVYGTLTTSVAGGSATITDLSIWPMVDWDVEDICQIKLDRLRLSSVPLLDLDNLRFKLHVSGGTVSADCLPPDVRGPALPVIGKEVRIPRGTIDIDYKIPTSSARMQVQLTLDGLASVGSTIELDYIWADASDQSRDPVPVIFLTSARTTLDNLGLWDKVKPMVPPIATDPAQFGAVIDQVIGQMGPAAQSPQAGELGDSVKAAWSEFLADPRRLVLETTFTDGPRLLRIEDWESHPEVMLDDLELRLTTKSVAVRSMPSSDLVIKAYESPDSLSEEDRLRIGSALATGSGAPRDVQQAQTVLYPLASSGNGQAALILAQALETRDPDQAYLYALSAAEQGAANAAGLLDRIENALPLARVLELQHSLVEGVEHPVDALDSLSSVRDEASKRLYGKGRSRSYEIAVLWASIGAAAGDDECIAILAEIDSILAGADPEARRIWAGQEAASAELARSAWTGFDLPASFGASR